MNLLQCALLLFAAGALGGLTLAVLIASRIRFPGWFGSAHGMLGLIASMVLLLANLRGGAATPTLAWWAFAVLVAALSGGAFLFRVLFRDKAPLPLVALHGVLALVGIALLYRAVVAG